MREIYLNTRINNHLIEDGHVIIIYSAYPPEPDVGYFRNIEFHGFRSYKTWRPLKRISYHISDDYLNEIYDEIGE